MELPNLPGWDINVEEVSAGVYRLRATHLSGAVFDPKGQNPVMLVQNLEEYAESIADH
jgi:hypothetical protein